jgi:hypothetical protein
VKKLIFALFGAVAMASIPLNVNAADSCAISVNSGETRTINYATNCRIENHGVLNITSGANINKYTRDAYAAIENYGTLTVSGGSIYADYGYAIRNRGGYINMYGGTVNSALHQSIWVTAGTVKITGGTLKSAGGYEENIYTTGKLQVCGQKYSYNSAAKVEDLCAKPITKPAANTSTNSSSEKITITVKTSEAKSNTATATAAPATVASKPATTTNTQTQTQTQTTAPVSAPATTTNDVLVKQEPVKEQSTETKKKEENAEDNSDTFIIAIAATLAVLSSATATIVVNRFRD